METKKILFWSLTFIVCVHMCNGAKPGTSNNGQGNNGQGNSQQGKPQLTANIVKKILEKAQEANKIIRENANKNQNGEKPRKCPMSIQHGKGHEVDPEASIEASDALLALRFLKEEYGLTSDDLIGENINKILRGVKGLECNLPDPGSCDFTSKYRTADGSCNNKENPRWGMAGMMQQRIVKSDYEDKFGKPRTQGLPNARHVSNIVHANPNSEEDLSDTNTLHLFAFGQLLDHDIILTPLSDVSNCCDNNNDLENCVNIIIEKKDAFMDLFEPGYCMEVPRSAPLFCPDATQKNRQRRQQINGISGFIDASNVYGSSNEEQEALREGGTGYLLKTARDTNQFNDERIAAGSDDACILKDPNQQCALAGDVRVNEMSTLTAYHFLFALEHNRIANVLKDYYNDDEIIFQETRKVLISVMQKIAYDDFMSALFSPKGIQTYKLHSSAPYTYNPDLDPSVFNAFGIAYRVGHSLVPKKIELNSKDLKLHDPHDFSMDLDQLYFNPNITYADDSFARLAYSLSSRLSPKRDNILEEPVRSRLFIDEEVGETFDLAALNIQRGREHGLPSYNEYRKFCGLKQVGKKWANSGLIDHSKDLRKKLKDAGYGSPRDIDLFTGGVSEESVSGGLLGPTFECLLGEQFRRLKYGDRFWFQSADTGFSAAQIKEIQKYSLSKVLCNNYNFAKVHYPNAFKAKDLLVQCDDVPDMDLSVFQV